MPKKIITNYISSFCILYRKSISSLVENTLTSDCYFSPISFDHKGKLNFKERARYCTSSISGNIFFASLMYSLNSFNGTNFTNVLINSKVNENCFSFRPNFSLISSLCFSIFFSKNSGERRLTFPESSIFSSF